VSAAPRLSLMRGREPAKVTAPLHCNTDCKWWDMEWLLPTALAMSILA
jgi:hypothetical protein